MVLPKVKKLNLGIQQFVGHDLIHIHEYCRAGNVELHLAVDFNIIKVEFCLLYLYLELP